MSSTQGHKLQL